MHPEAAIRSRFVPTVKVTRPDKEGAVRDKSEGDPMTDQPHGRYFAQELVLDQDADTRGQIQAALDAGEGKEWHLVGVSDVPPEHRIVLFWDTIRPSFGRTSQ